METIYGWLIERTTSDNTHWYARRVNGSRKYHVTYSKRDDTFYIRNDLGSPISTSTGIGAGMLNAIRVSKQWVRK